jgi:rhodanese-related sulfurtransferase/glyoxylase-like metal-dependent hydrolase (beta-lactamase superfamily II)
MLNIEEPIEVEPETLKQKIDLGEEFVLLDVRTPWEHEAWGFNYSGVRPVLLPIQDLFSQPDDALAKIPKDKEVFVLCAHGNRSLFAAEMLCSLGYRAKSVRGGINMINTVCDVAQINLPGITLLQVRRIAKGCVGYIIVSNDSSEAVIVDPQYLCHNNYVELVRRLGLKVTGIVDTHVPLDHLSWSSSLSERLGAPVYKLGNPLTDGGQAKKETTTISLNPYSDAATILLRWQPQLGVLSIYSSGEHVPDAVFAADTLCAYGYGRPDATMVPPHQRAKELYLIYETLFTELGDQVLVLPSHCDPASLRRGVPQQTTVGELRRKLWSPKPSPERFTDYLLSSLPPKPANHEAIAQLNAHPQRLIPAFNEKQLRDLEGGSNNMCVPTNTPPAVQS